MNPGLIGVPAVEWIWTRAAFSLMEVYGGAPRGTQLSLEMNRSTISGKRNALVEQALESRAPWLLFLDSDMIFPADTVSRLLNRERKVVGGLYCARTPDYHAMAGHAETRESYEDSLRPTDQELGYESLDLTSLAGLMEVDVVGTGCLLVRREVFERMEPPWFVANQERHVGQNEDYNFCLRAKQLGYRIYCDTDLACEHLGSEGVTVDRALAYHGRKRRQKVGLVR